MILAEYDIVATGLKTLSRQVHSAGDSVPKCLHGQLRDVEVKFSFCREEIWLAQVNDAELGVLLATLDGNFTGGDPLAALSISLHAIKRLLTPLSNSFGAVIHRSAYMRKNIVAVSIPKRVFSFFVLQGAHF